MSLELDWSLLTDDESLSNHFKTILNRALSSAKRPDFIGPIEITHLDLGQEGLDVEVTKIGDLWKDFVEIDGPPLPNIPNQSVEIRDRPTDPSSAGLQFQHHHPHHPHQSSYQSKEKGNRRNSRGRRDRNGQGGEFQEEENSDGGVDRFMNRNLPVPRTNKLQTLRQYDSEVDAQMIGGGTVTGSNTMTGSGNGGSGSIHPNQGYRPWSAGLGTSSYSAGGGIQTPWNHRNGHYGSGGGGIGTPISNGNGGYFSHWQPQPPPPAPATRQGSFAASRSNYPNSPPTDWGGPDNHLQSSDSSSSSLPSLQIHASLTWPTTSLRLTLSTSLLINYPSPMFMSLPLQITATGFILQAGLILALEGEKKRIHISLLPDDDDVPIDIGAGGPTNAKDFNQDFSSDDVLDSGDNTAKVVQSSKPPPSISGSAIGIQGSTTSKSTSDIPQIRPTPGLYSRQNSNHPHGYLNDVKSHSVGARLLPSMTFESSVGQADKHTLRNVGKVEKFVLDLVRKGIEDELVFPSFYTVNLPR